MNQKEIEEYISKNEKKIRSRLNFRLALSVITYRNSHEFKIKAKKFSGIINVFNLNKKEERTLTIYNNLVTSHVFILFVKEDSIEYIMCDKDINSIKLVDKKGRLRLVAIDTSLDLRIELS